MTTEADGEAESSLDARLSRFMALLRAAIPALSRPVESRCAAEDGCATVAVTVGVDAVEEGS